MKRRLGIRRAGVALALIAALVLASAALARGPDLLRQFAGYDLSWWTADSGGGTSTSGDYTLSSTAGQPDAGVQLATGAYSLTGGFWGGGQIEYRINLPLALRNHP